MQLCLISVLFFLQIGAPLVFAQDPPAEKVEPSHAKAVIAFNEKNYEKALSLLNGLITDYPKYTPAWELKALILRAQKQDRRALEIYNKLLSFHLPERQKGGYHFEMATVYYAENKFDIAREHYNLSMNADFNVAACHFFVGLIDYNEKNYKAAERHLFAARASTATELHPMADLYLGLVYAKLGYAPGIMRGMVGAQQGLGDQKEVRKITDEILKNFDKAQFFGNLTFSTQFDNNISVLPDTAGVAVQTAGQKTAKEVISGGVGYSTSPLRLFQVTPQYRVYYNYNFNPASKGYSFLSHMPSVLVTLVPYGRFSLGFKVDANYTFNDHVENTQTVFRPYSLTWNVGPIFKAEVWPRITATLEYMRKPKKFYLDPESGVSRRSGDGDTVKLSLTWDSLLSLVNPTTYIGYENDITNGSEYRFRSWSFGFNNVFKLTSRDSLTMALDFYNSSYYARSELRVDKNYASRGLYSHSFTNHIALLADVSYAFNDSNVTQSFRYQRFTGSLGMNVSL